MQLYFSFFDIDFKEEGRHFDYLRVEMMNLRLFQED